jgi:hypothetical protein
LHAHPIFDSALRSMSGDATRAVVDGAAARAKGNHLAAQNDETEPFSLRSEMQAMADVIKARAPLFPLTPHRPAQPIALPSMEQYVSALKRHDWHYQQADDYGSYLKGQRERDALVTLQQRLDTDYAIWNEHARDCQRAPSACHEQPQPMEHAAMNTIHKGSLIIDRRNMRDFAHITEVTGDLSIEAEGAALPVLQSVGGDLYIEAEGAALPVLQSVGGYLHIGAEGAALPVLQSVGGYLYIEAEGAALPALQSVGGYLYIGAEGARN